MHRPLGGRSNNATKGHQSGPHQRSRWRGVVMASQTTWRGASNVRVIRISVSDGNVTVADPWRVAMSGVLSE